MSGLLDDLAAWNPRGGVMVTVVQSLGSTPRGCGSYMIVDSAGRLAAGSIGGGALELEAVERARAILSGGSEAAMSDVPLGPQLGQCCGGQVTLLFEPLPIAVRGAAERGNAVVVTELEPPFARQIVDEARLDARGCLDFGSGGRIACLDGRRVLVQPPGRRLQPAAIFGAGHVGRALVRALAPLPFALRWIDDRADQFPEDARALAEVVVTAAPADQVAALPAGSFVLIMTHSHGLDFDILRRALGRDDLGYVGLIGSATKRAKFVKRLRGYGVGEAAIARLTCPIGLPQIAGKEPAVIAASVAADLLIRLSRASAAAGPVALRAAS
jgi:xanthine dehydrogenase accessory factor